MAIEQMENYDFVQAGQLKRHLKTHSGEKPNKCNQCEFAPFRADVLRKHFQTHSGSKAPFSANHMLAILGQRPPVTIFCVLFVTNVEIYSIRIHICKSIQSITIEVVKKCIICYKRSI